MKKFMDLLRLVYKAILVKKLTGAKELLCFERFFYPIYQKPISISGL